MARSFLCMIVFASLLLSAPSRAAEPARRALRLRYSEDAQAASCPGERALRERIRLRVGYDPFREDATEEVAVAIRPHGAHVVATTTYRNADGRVSGRGFDLSHGDGACEQLTQTVAVAISFTLTPFASDEQAPAAPPRPEIAPVRPEPASRPGEPWSSARVGVGAIAGLGVPEGLFGGASLLVRVRWSQSLSFSLESRGTFVVSTPSALGHGEVSSPDAPSPGGGTDARSPYLRTHTSGAFAPCLHTVDLLVTCALVEMGVAQVGDRAAPATDVSLLFMALGLRGGIELALNDTLSFYTHAEVLAALGLVDHPLAGALRPPRPSASLGAGLLAGF
ncbi:hypothetical protein WMF27_15780 [Sorangium sp. So ce281]|uniref:hypothetical protein n=1 Tax=unclassified Sorangium TaxID=2621164 RepID=UPI003F5D9B2A